METPFRELAGAYKDKVYTYAFYSLRSHEEAEDVTQEVLVKLWQHLREVDPGSLDAWVMRVARNAVIDVARRRRTQSAVIAGGVEVETVAVRASADGYEADHRVRSRELGDALESALASLGEPHRSIIVMREIQGMRYDEIADALEMPLGTIKVYLHRGRKLLREALRGKV
jgi:RNA polymerase sigma-70 factor (ECF subfamily)